MILQVDQSLTLLAYIAGSGSRARGRRTGLVVTGGTVYLGAASSGAVSLGGASDSAIKNKGVFRAAISSSIL